MSLFLVSCIFCILSVFQPESILFMHILNSAAGRGQPLCTPPLISTDCYFVAQFYFYLIMFVYLE
jgi:hypothetical protein